MQHGMCMPDPLSASSQSLLLAVSANCSNLSTVATGTARLGNPLLHDEAISDFASPPGYLSDGNVNQTGDTCRSSRGSVGCSLNLQL